MGTKKYDEALQKGYCDILGVDKYDLEQEDQYVVKMQVDRKYLFGLILIRTDTKKVKFHFQRIHWIVDGRHGCMVVPPFLIKHEDRHGVRFSLSERHIINFIRSGIDFSIAYHKRFQDPDDLEGADPRSVRWTDGEDIVRKLIANKYEVK